MRDENADSRMSKTGRSSGREGENMDSRIRLPGFSQIHIPPIMCCVIFLLLNLLVL
jgi:hypothetical protein